MTLRAKVLSGLFWTGGTRLLSQVLTWVITIFVIRLLTPSDYGLLAMAMVMMGFLGILAEAGLGSAITQAAELDDAILRRIFGVVIVVYGALFALQFAMAPLVASFFDEGRLVLIVRVLALHFLLSSFAVIPGALLNRRLDFRRQSMIGLASAVTASLTSLALAAAGYGVWALIVSNLVATALVAVLVNFACPFLRWPEFSLRGTRGLIVAGSQFTAQRALYFAYSQADIFIGGRFFGKELLGFYSIALHLASLPVQRISSIVNQITFPAFVEARHEPRNVPSHMLMGIRILSFFSFPVLWGMSSIADEIVAVVLGPKWGASVVPLRLLSLVMPMTILGPFLNAAFQGIGHSQIVLKNALTAALILPAAFWIGAHSGLLGLSMAWVVGFPIVLFSNLRRMLPMVGLRIESVLGAAMRPAAAGLGMYGCVALARWLLADRVSALLMMGALIVVGATAYALITLLINKTGVREVIGLFRRRPAGGKAAPS